MATYTCSISGLTLHTEWLAINIPPSPGVQSEAVIKHPIFTLSQRQLLPLARTLPSMHSTEQYLYFLALANSTGLVRWNHSAKMDGLSLSTCAAQMERMLQIVGKINIIQHPSFRKPALKIGAHNCSLQAVPGWLDGIDSAFTEWYDDYKTVHYTQELIKRKSSLEYMVKNAGRDESRFAYTLANWAELAGSFPVTTFTDTRTIPHTFLRLSDYWKEIIILCAAKNPKLLNIPRVDFVELIEHCEEHIELGTIYSHALMEHLYNGMSKQKNYLGFGDIGIGSRGSIQYAIVQEDNPVQEATIAALIASVESNEARPIEKDYPTKFAFIKANAKWELAQKYGASSTVSGANYTGNSSILDSGSSDSPASNNGESLI